MRIDDKLLNFIRPSEHSTFSPSAADRWMACPYSVKACESIPEQTSKYAEEGTLAHKVCEDLFAHVFYDVPKSNDLQFADQEMLDAAQMYVDTVIGWLKSEYIGKVLFFGLEKGIPVYADKGCFGTADCLIIGEKGSAVIDFKYGKGLAVSARSTQLMIYLLGVYEHLHEIPAEYKFFSVVVQPRKEMLPKVAEYTIGEMFEFAPKVKNAIEEAYKPGLQPVESSKGCYWCKARRTNDPALKCPLQAEKAMAVMNEDFDGFLRDMNAPVNTLAEANPKRDRAILKAMSLLPLMQKIAKDGEEEFLMRLRRGEKIPGVNLTQKEGRRQWAHDEDEMVKKLKALYPQLAPQETVVKLKTITQVEKEVGKKQFDNSLTIKKLSETVVLQDEKVQEILGELSSYGQTIEMEKHETLENFL